MNALKTMIICYLSYRQSPTPVHVGCFKIVVRRLADDVGHRNVTVRVQMSAVVLCTIISLVSSQGLDGK